MASQSRDLSHLLQGQTLEVLLDAANNTSDNIPETNVRIGIASMIKQAGEEIFLTWLEYHAVELAVERFYLRIEDTPSLAPLLKIAPWRERVKATFVEGTVRDWSGVATRQAHHVRASIEAARRAKWRIVFSSTCTAERRLLRKISMMQSVGEMSVATSCASVCTRK